MTRPKLDDSTRNHVPAAPQPDASLSSTQHRPANPPLRSSRIGSLHIGLVVAAVLLVALVVFLAQNGRAVNIRFLGAHLRVSLAVALLTAAVAGALIVGAVGAARITQLRLNRRRR